MPQLAISTLGSLRITLGGRLVDAFGSDKAVALLVYLGVEGDRPHRRERLAGLLWPESPEANARHSLSQVLTDLRSLVGDRAAAAEGRAPYLDTTRGTVAINPRSDYWVDARVFDALSARTTSVIRPVPGNGEILEPLVRAIGLYQGAFLEGFSIGDAYPFEEWMLLLRERYTRRAIEALRQLTTAYSREGDYVTAVRYAWRWVEMDPWQEAAQRELIRLLALRGQRTTALRQYEVCRGILREELGVEPEPETQALAEAVRTGQLPGGSVGAPPTLLAPKTAPPPAFSDVPAPLTPLIGREAELDDLGRWLRDPATRLVTLVGPGGIGKTRLAVELATIHAPRFPDGAYVVSLVAATSWEASLAAIAKAVGLVPSPRFPTVELQLRDFLKDKSALLVLDNFEHLVAHAPRLVRMLEFAPQLRVIITSRTRLGTLGEQTYPVEPLAVPNQPDQAPCAQTAAALAEVASVALFTQSARRVAHDFDPSGADMAAIAAICRLVEGIPLALLLAAAWTPVLTPHAILKRLAGDTDAPSDRPIDFLQARWPEIPARHRSLRAVFDHTWQMLGTRAHMLVQALSVFRGGFGAEAAYYVTGATLPEIRQLLAQSLLACTSRSRYGVHELLRQYAAERLAQVPDAQHEVRDRHAAYYAMVLQRWFEAAKGPMQVSALAEMDAEIDNAQAAWAWMVRQGDIGQMTQAVDGLMLYYDRRVRSQEAQRACRRALDGLELSHAQGTPDSVARQRLVAKLLIWQSEMERGEEAMASVDRALATLSAPTIPLEEVRLERGRALRRKASLLSDRERERAMALYEESLSHLRAVGDRWEEARTLDGLASLHDLLGDHETAGSTCERLLSISRELGDARGAAWALNILSAIAMYRNELKDAVRLGEESLALQRELDDPLEVAFGLGSLATRQLLAVRPDIALPLFDEAIAIQDRLGVPTPYARGVKAWGLMHVGDYDQARPLVRRALADAHTTRSRRLIAWNDYVVGCLSMVAGDADAAVRNLESAAVVFRDLHEPIYFGMTQSALGLAYRARGDRDRARSCFVEVLQKGEDLGGRAPVSWALLGMALLYADAGDPARARQLVSIVDQTWPFVTRSKWVADVAGPAYHAALAAMPEESAAPLGPIEDMAAAARAILRELATGP